MLMMYIVVTKVIFIKIVMEPNHKSLKKKNI